MITNPVIPVLRGGLLERDQRARRALGDRPTPVRWQAACEVDVNEHPVAGASRRSPRLARARLVGPAGANVAWLIARHVPAEQRTLWLSLPRGAVRNGDAAVRDLACPPNRVNDRRARVNRPPLRQADVAAAWPILNLGCEQVGLVGGTR
jgi:hypothetical protein